MGSHTHSSASLETTWKNLSHFQINICTYILVSYTWPKETKKEKRNESLSHSVSLLYLVSFFLVLKHRFQYQILHRSIRRIDKLLRKREAMALSLASAPTWCLSILILAIETQGVYGSNRGNWFGINKVDVVAPEVVGICASSVVVHGYKCQEIEVTTEDGYILSVQRIPEGRVGVGVGSRKKQPVLIQHGVLVDGMTWLLNPPEQNLPLILADNGFDVWIANTRGTRFSRRHVSMDPTQPKFWNWSWDELVTFDLPALFDHVYKETGQKIDYIGHSLGTLIALASLSEGMMVDQLKSAALLSPIAYLSHMNTALGVVAAKSFVGEITTLFGLKEFNPKGEAVVNFLKSLCAHPGVDCYDLLSAVTGKNCCLNASTVDLFLKNEPQSTSTKNMVHLAQTVRDGVLAKFNYGIPGFNIMHYGEAKPPIYNLSNIPRNLPLFITYGGLDALSDPRDVGLLLDSLKFHDVDKLNVQFIKNYAHADFIMGVNAKDLVYNKVISFFNLQH